MATVIEPDKGTYQAGKSVLSTWVLGTGIITGGISWYFTKSLQAAGACGAVSALILLLSARTFWWRAQETLLLELQSFLFRFRILPEDYKIIRNASHKTIRSKKKEMLELAYKTFSETEKKLAESRHILDKFVGTRASQIATETGNKAVWEGELTRAIVLFSDVRGFTAMTEKLRPQETVRYLNRMFTELEEIITFSGGEINKFIGDAILAFFPFPAENEAEAVRKALHASLQMQDGFHSILAAFKNNYSEVVETGLGIGLVAGNVIMGNLGSARRMEFTVIGDTVNFASRLCSLAEDGQILIDENLALGLAGSFHLEKLAPVKIKGKKGMHTPFVVIGERIQTSLS
jgi:class 3 adenylate cyclase